MAVKTEKIQYNQLPRPTFRWMKAIRFWTSVISRVPMRKNSKKP